MIHLSSQPVCWNTGGCTHLSEDMLASMFTCRSVAEGSRLWDKFTLSPTALSPLWREWDIWASSFILSFPSALTCTELLPLPAAVEMSAVAFTFTWKTAKKKIKNRELYYLQPFSKTWTFLFWDHWMKKFDKTQKRPTFNVLGIFDLKGWLREE